MCVSEGVCVRERESIFCICIFCVRERKCSSYSLKLGFTRICGMNIYSKVSDMYVPYVKYRHTTYNIVTRTA